MSVSHDLQRFIDAQNPVYQIVCSELRAGKKLTHWMWFIFPQIAGLGRSSRAKAFAIQSADEALAFLDHPILGQRLRDCTRMTLAAGKNSANEIFDYPDNLKFCSSMTLFGAMTDEVIFSEAIETLCGGERDVDTLDALGLF